MYRFLFRAFLLRLDPERAHAFAFAVIRFVGLPAIGWVVALFTRPSRDLGVTALGLKFPSSFGIAAGFDKHATGIRGLGNLGFGHVEVGTLTALAQAGNPRPRLFRLPQDRALINRMGFNNAGASEALPRLERQRRRKNGPIVGVNIGKSRAVAVEDATPDYVASARLVAPVADYLVVNVSSPNTPGLRGLQDAAILGPLVTAVKEVSGATPVLVKIDPDLSDPEILAICRLVVELRLDGIVATNTTVHRDSLVTKRQIVDAAGAGGLSGRPLAGRSLAVLRLVREHVPEAMCVISVGGVETASDVRERLRAGATLVQGYTGFVYRGPLWAMNINRGLARLAMKDTARA